MKWKECWFQWKGDGGNGRGNIGKTLGRDNKRKVETQRGKIQREDKNAPIEGCAVNGTEDNILSLLVYSISISHTLRKWIRSAPAAINIKPQIDPFLITIL